MLLLLIQYDEPRIFAGGEHRRAGSHHHFGIAGFDPFPLVIPFTRGQAAVQHRHRIPKVGSQQSQKLGGQSDFRHQQHSCFPALQALLNELDIDRCFTGTGNAVKQCHAGIFTF